MAEMLNSVQERETVDVASVSPVRRARPTAFGARINLLPAVRSEIIPRLHAALQTSLSLPRPVLAGPGSLIDERPALTERLLAGDDLGVRDQIERLRIAGCSLETIYLDLLAPTACHLRDLWSDDQCGLADVTLALCALQGVLRHYAIDFHAEGAARGPGHRALLVSPTQRGVDVGLPTFGLVLMSQFFRREGWDTWVERDMASPGFRGTVLAEWFDLVEILATGDDQLDAISSGIRAIRRGSPNPSVGVIVCGQIFLDRPDYVRLVGADLVAADPLSSVSQAKVLAQSASSQDALSQDKPFVAHPTPRKRLS